MDAQKFIETWKGRDGNELGNSQSFLNELCDLLDVPRPHDPNKGGTLEEYSFERAVTFKHNNGKTSKGRIDLYRRGCFVLEAKQGSEQKARIADPRQHELITGEPLTKQAAGMAVRGTPSWTAAMLKAKGQAYAYARALDISEGWPPFLIVVDIGHVIDLYADFSGSGKNYTPFPDRQRYRLDIEDLHDPETLDLLHAVWMDPTSLDPTAKTARVTRQISDELAALGRSFHEQGHAPEVTARFLMRCLFTMFAEDVHLIPADSFTNLLIDMRGQPENAAPTLEALWQGMDKGGFSPVLRRDLLRFNGGLFAESTALPLNSLQLGLLIRAAEQDWREVEPAIFGTLLERALSAKDRHKLGAHFTPRAYVERLVTPTIMEPLRGDWMDVQAAAITLQEDGKLDDAIDTVREFLAKLCNIRVLDPACGSGNFLYVALEGMKRLEGEVISFLDGLGDRQTQSITVDPHQFLGIELNPWAANVAELVLWIGYLQWHFRTYGNAAPSEPVLRDFKNIRQGDAVLEWADRTPRIDQNGTPVTRWDGVTTMRHPVTGEEVPDPDARVQVYDYKEPKATVWPQSDFIVGNPPFIGASRLRDSLGDGYVEALWKAYPKMPQSADLVMFWWEKAALAARAYNAKTGKGTRRFGLITTNSLRQTFNRRVLEPHLNDPKKPLSLLFAIPDHPWVDTLYGAAVRIAMTVGAAGNRAGRLQVVATESKETTEAEGRQVTFDHQVGKIFANLQIGADVSSTVALLSNSGLGHKGVMPWGMGFVLSKEEAESLAQDQKVASLIFDYANGKDLVGQPRNLKIIDCFGLSEDELRSKYPAIFQLLWDRVKPDRDTNNRKSYRDYWWIFAEPRKEMRKALAGTERYIATTETAKHRIFHFLDKAVLADQKIRVVALEEAWQLSVLSSRVHIAFALSRGNWQGVGNDPVYTHSTCFNPFPFPDLTNDQRTRLRVLGEELDAHRKRQQATHPKLTLTQMYNVLEKLRAGEAIGGKDREIYDQGLIGILKDLHDQIDAAVAEAYGWPVDLSDEDILFRLVALNKERAEEEARGHIRWLRPDYQNPTGETAMAKDTGKLDLAEVEVSTEIYEWPKAMPLQVAFVRNTLVDLGESDTETVARHFKRAPRKTVRDILESLTALGHVRQTGDDKFAA
ncbi:MAG: hypothetical protein QNI84_00640 [Henriciella sp.]|nr:hypothetical protein [Henriciella sp.]